MFASTEDLAKFILAENIIHLEIRSITKTSTKSVVFTANYAINNLDFLKNNFNDNNISITNIDLNSSFVEVFLAHKTLVLFAESLQLLNHLSFNKYSFAIVDNNNNTPLSSPEVDNYRDFIGEISSSLLDIGEKVAYFYKDNNNLHSLVLQESSKYSKEKIRYAISMVAKAYNITVNVI
ncbi:MAG: hypothetical protein LBH40_04260 [Alphaproteobacteria bacterium]|jgi:hypothetical protein|nr:hypothetical protein [Alphaproteobacteria bacterium]